jgi:hypothetical protein
MSAAVDLDNALKSALKKQESELRAMEARSESCRDWGKLFRRKSE